MPKTNSIVDCERFCEAIEKAGGCTPLPLAQLLSITELLMAPGAASDPLGPVLDAAMAGQLDQRKLDKMLADAATQTQIDSYKQDLRPHAERAIVRRFHRVLRDGAADDVLSSMRDGFTEHARAIARTRAVINPDSELEHVIACAQPGDDTIALWQQLPVHLAAVAKVGAVAAQFGVRPTAQFSLIAEHPGDNHRTDDRALYCCQRRRPGGRLDAVCAMGPQPGASPLALVPGAAGIEHCLAGCRTLQAVVRKPVGGTASQQGRPVHPAGRRQCRRNNFSESVPREGMRHEQATYPATPATASAGPGQPSAPPAGVTKTVHRNRRSANSAAQFGRR